MHTSYPQSPPNSAGLSIGRPCTQLSPDPRRSGASFWRDRYPALSQVRPGLYGAATSRAEAQVLRLSAIYAVLDCSPTITLPHLQAALAVWDYCSAGASVLFGTSTGDHTADRIREAINASSDGLSRKQISALFHGHLSSDRIEAALDQLVSLDAIPRTAQPSGGRPSTLWSAIPESECLAGEDLHHESTVEETARRGVNWGADRQVSEKSFFASTNRNMQPKIHRSATTYSVQNSISDTLRRVTPKSETA